MKILIGTPIHISKDYAMERWLQNVSRLKHPADLFLVDNSPGLDYMEKVRKYCSKYRVNPVRNLGQSPISNGVKNYKAVHIDFDQGMSIDEKDRRIEAAQEIIRKEILSHNYDAWFSWECDQIIPTDALDKLINLMKSGNFMVVAHNSWARNNPGESNPDMGVALIKRECLEKYGFLPKHGSPHWQGGSAWFKERVFREGGNYIDVYGVIKSIYHLSK